MNILINTVNFIMLSLFLVSMFLLLSLFVFYGTNKKSFIEIRDEYIQNGFFYTTNYICNIVFWLLWELLSIMFPPPDNN
ncbi:hypothetical protein C6H66_06955 [Photorhabdus hindustanensis]|uniref:Uncharacterized protein n=1 Tax=Photorhabdus hindustanensis TaxID=2918802 RepID=A0A2S8Q519_9GAMM|nr:hypothetical protein C6H66_06955 [Photorhabdus hindustanensis]